MNNKFYFFIFIFSLCTKIIVAQNSIKLAFYNFETNEIISVDKIYIDDKEVLNFNGIISIPSKTVHLQASKIGYKNLDTTINSSLKNIKLPLNSKFKSLQITTISGSKFEKKLEEEIVSIEVIKPKQILNAGVNTMSDALNRIPGVDVIENQVNIRGGAGWSYGAGSRVQVLVDDIPMITADANDVKWNFLPIENCDQIEVIKGASSALYGASALNGVVNFRTAYAKSKPITKAMIYSGLYSQPQDPNWTWWNNRQQPFFYGAYFTHAQKSGNLDWVLGAATYKENSYLQGANEERYRINGNLRFNNPIHNKWVYGVNFNFQKSSDHNFFFWESKDSITNYLQPYGGLNIDSTTINSNQGTRLNIDPYLTYTSKSAWKISFRNRWFLSQNLIPLKNQSSDANLFYSELMAQKNIKSKNKITNGLFLNFGLVQNLQFVKGELYGNHNATNRGYYTQLEKKYNKFWVSLGIRLETNKVDTYKMEYRPVARFGVNYQISKATFLRASIGQGYRYPSIAERFVYTSFGAAKVLPNPTLQSEKGLSAEVGVKQILVNKKIKGYLDFASFYMKYNNMMEFNFGLHLPKDSTAQQLGIRALDYLGFQSVNVGNTQVYGLDFSANFALDFQKTSAIFIFGYTFMHPTYLNPDSVIIANFSGDKNWLKYRTQNTLKFETDWKFHKIGVDFVALYNSFMMNIDEVFTNTKPSINPFGTVFNSSTHGLSTSVQNFRIAHNKGNMINDFRLHFFPNEKFKISFIVKNIFNVAYMQRPALISPLRNYTLQLALNL